MTPDGRGIASAGNDGMVQVWQAIWQCKRQGLAEIARVLKPGGRLFILDFIRRQTQRTQSRIKRHVQQRGSHAFFAHFLHAGLERGIEDLAPVMKEVGFSQIETGESGFWTLGFALGRISADLVT